MSEIFPNPQCFNNNVTCNGDFVTSAVRIWQSYIKHRAFNISAAPHLQSGMLHREILCV